MIGKWHLGFYKSEYLPWNRGFQTFYGFLNGGSNYYTRNHCEPKKTRRYCGIDLVDSRRGVTNSTWGKYSEDLFLRRAIRLIGKHAKNKTRHKPMFLYLSLQSVHGPLQRPPRFRRKFRHIKDINRRIYAMMLYSMDRNIRKLVSALKQTKMWKNTIFIFSTDNGGQTMRGGNNYPLRGRKGTLWEGGTRGVGFIHGRILKLSSPYVNRKLIHISDWFPTLMTASKCPIVDGTQVLDGFDQWDTISKNESSKRTEILINIDPLYKRRTDPEVRNGFDTSVRAGIRSGDWKLLTGDVGMDRWVIPPEWNKTRESFSRKFRLITKNIKLFHISEDPYEKEEVSDLHPEVVDLLLSRLVEYNASAVPVRYPKMERKADPKRNGGFWGPWRNGRNKIDPLFVWKDEEDRRGAFKKKKNKFPTAAKLIENRKRLRKWRKKKRNRIHVHRLERRGLLEVL